MFHLADSIAILLLLLNFQKVIRGSLLRGYRVSLFIGLGFRAHKKFVDSCSYKDWVGKVLSLILENIL